MRSALINTVKAVVFFLIFLAITTSISTVILLLWKPELVIEQVQMHFVKPEPIKQVELKAIGIIGDSQSDEYRADDNRGVNYPTSTYNWVEILAKERNINFGTWNYYEEPRRQGYEYNFARSGATAGSMTQSGQHIGLADYVKKGEVNVVIIYIGANDFAPYLYDNAYSAIYNEELSREEIIRKENSIVADIQTAIETLQEAGDPKIFVVTIPDWGNHTAVKIGFPLPYKRYLVTQVINETNRKLRSVTEEYGVETIEVNDFYQGIRGNDTNYQVKVGDVILDQYIGQNNPRYLFLSDGIHPGTVLNGLFANYLVEHINPHLINPIKPLTTDEILRTAGL